MKNQTVEVKLSLGLTLSQGKINQAELREALKKAVLAEAKIPNSPLAGLAEGSLTVCFTQVVKRVDYTAG